MIIEGFHARIPLQPHQMTTRLTSREDMIVLCHLGVPKIDVATWRLTIDGMVKRPIQLSLQDLKQLPQTTIHSVHQCAGSPLKPEAPTRRITNVAWTGVRLSELVARCCAADGASYAWSYGADAGTFHDATVDAFLKDMPLARVDQDVIIALELNGEPLRPENGFPARLVVPGFYGTNSVKWVTRISLSDRRADSPFTTRWYNDPVVGTDGAPTGRTTPVWAIAPESVIVSPAPNSMHGAGGSVPVWGWAWADGQVASVDFSCDGGASWVEAHLEAGQGRGWQRFDCTWSPTPGTTALASRARSTSGLEQPLHGRRNAVHFVPVQVL